MESYYGHLFRDTAVETVSLHLMLSAAGRSKTKMINDRAFPTLLWYEKVLLTEFKPSEAFFVVVSDDPELAAPFMKKFEPAIKYIIVRENSVVALHLMNRCVHHVLTSSPLSFWGLPLVD